MNSFYSYKIFTEHNLIYAYFYSKINVEDLKQYMKELTSESAYSAGFNVISDLRDSILSVKSDEIVHFYNYLKNDLGVLTQRKEVFIAGAANESVTSMIYSIYLKNFNLHTEIFNNTEDALEYLNIDDSLTEYFKSEFEQVKQKHSSTLR